MSVRAKRALATLAAPTGILSFQSRIRTGLVRELLLLAYHRILPFETGSQHCGDIELISATPEDFAWQVEYVCRNFEPVTFAQIADAFDGRAALPRRACAITFDDGFSDGYEHAYPVLRRHQIPATIFVSTGFVGTDDPYWFDLVAYLVNVANIGNVVLVKGYGPIEIPESDSARAQLTYRLLKWLKNCNDDVRVEALEALTGAFDFQSRRAREVLGKSLSWDQIKEMHSGGIEFGSHTVSHKCLAKLAPDELDSELRESKASLEHNLRKEVCSIAYPFGGDSAFDDGVIEATKRAGYRVAASYLPGRNVMSRSNRFALRRQHVELDTSRDYFKAMINAPEIFD